MRGDAAARLLRGRQADIGPAVLKAFETARPSAKGALEVGDVTESSAPAKLCAPDAVAWWPTAVAIAPVD